MFFKILRVVFTERKIAGAIVFTVSGFAFLFFYFVRDKVSTRADLVEVQSLLSNCSFVEDRGYRYHTFNYYLTLDGYSAQFQIIADFTDLFYKDEFKKDVKQGDSVSVWIAKSNFQDVQKEKNIMVFMISTRQRVYLEDRFTISEYNNRFRIYAGLVFLLVGAFLLFKNREKLKFK